MATPTALAPIVAATGSSRVPLTAARRSSAPITPVHTAVPAVVAAARMPAAASVARTPAVAVRRAMVALAAAVAPAMQRDPAGPAALVAVVALVTRAARAAMAVAAVAALSAERPDLARAPAAWAAVEDWVPEAVSSCSRAARWR